MSAFDRVPFRAPMRRRYVIAVLACLFAWVVWPATAPATTHDLADAAATATRQRLRELTPDEQKDAVTELYLECLRDLEQPRSAVDTSPGDGPTVAVLGDSITTQIRTELVWSNTQQLDLTVWSRCGADTASVERDGGVDAVLASRPTALVVALGTNDTAWEIPKPDNARQFAARADALLDRAAAAGVDCVAWIDVAATPGHGAYAAEAAKINAEIQRLGAERRDPRVVPVDWDTPVRAEPGLLFDGVHLSDPGVAAREAITDQAIAACLPRSR